MVAVGATGIEHVKIANRTSFNEERGDIRSRLGETYPAGLASAKAMILDDPACDPDWEEMEAELGLYDLTDDELLAAWLNRDIGRLISGGSITVHRHLTVPDFEVFVSDAINGGDLGDHWSDNPDTWSHYCDALGGNVRVTGCVSVSDVDWFATLQRRLAFPAEREVVFEGGISLLSIADIDDGRAWSPQGGFAHCPAPRP